MSYRDALVDNAESALCGWLGLQDNLNRLGQDAFAALLRRTTDGFITPVRLPNPAGYWYQLLCDRPSPPPPPPPYSGGQCDGVPYRVSVVTTRTGGDCEPRSDATGSIDVWGPVQAVYLEPVDPPTGNQTQTIRIVCRGRTNDPIQPIVTISGGQRSNLASDDCPPPSIVDIQITRLDGMPDDCGDPDTYLPLPVPLPRPIVDVPGFTWVDIDMNVQIQPSFRIRINRPNVTLAPDFNIPIDVDLGGGAGAGAPPFAPSVSINFNLNGTVNIGFPGGTNPLPDNPDDGLVDPNPIPVPDVPPLPKPDPRLTTLLYGVVVTARQVNPSRVTIVQLDSDPTLYAPDAATVNFVYRIGETNMFGRPLRVQNGKSILYSDNEFECVDVKVQGRPGWDIDFETLTREVPNEYLVLNGYPV